MARYRDAEVPAVPARGHEALPQGRALLHRQVRDRAAELSAGPARPEPRQAHALRRPAAREAEGQAHLRRAGEPVPPATSSGPSARRASPARTCSSLLELRLDNVVYRLGFAASRRESRQMVAHGHFQVNGRKVSMPSFLVKVGDVVALRPTSKLARACRRQPQRRARRRSRSGSTSTSNEQQGRGARPAAARGHPDPGARAAHRRAVQQVGATRERMPRIPFQKPKKVEWEILSDRYGRLVGGAVREGLRAHRRQLPAPHAAVHRARARRWRG